MDIDAFKMLSGKPIRKIPFGRPRRRWEDNIKMYLKEIGINTRNSVDSIQDRDSLESPCECGIKPPGSINDGVNYRQTTLITSTELVFRVTKSNYYKPGRCVAMEVNVVIGFCSLCVKTIFFPLNRENHFPLTPSNSIIRYFNASARGASSFRSKLLRKTE